MPRTATTAQAAALEAQFYRGALRVKIADADNVLRDWSNQADGNWIQSVEVDGDVDQQVSGATVTLRRESSTSRSIAPFVAVSTLNRNALNDFAPAIDIGRLLVVEVATVEAGTEPEDGDFIELFRGFVDRFTWASSAVVLTLRDLGGALVDRFIEVPTNYGSTGGTAMQTVMGDILNDWGDGTALHYTDDPDFEITTYAQSVQSVMDALFALAQTIGWGLYTLWDDGASAWRLTLVDPDRTKSVPDLTIPKSRVISFTDLFIDRDKIRNDLKLSYPDATLGRTSVTASDSDSQDEYGVRWFGITEPDDSPIKTNAEALREIDSILADLKNPKAEQEVELRFDWRIQINDLLKFKSDGLHYDSDQTGAVVSFKHTLSAGKWRTTVRTRGNPAGAYLGWFARAQQATAIGPTLRVQATPNGDGTYTIEWSGSLVSLVIDDGLGNTPPDSPFTVTQDLYDHLYTFVEVGNGPVTVQSVAIPAVFKTGPGLSWDADASGNLSIGITARRGTDSTFVAVRTDRKPLASEILAGQRLGPGVGTGTMVYTDNVLPGSVPQITPHTHFFIGAISQTSGGQSSDPTYIDPTWSGIGTTPLPAVTLTEKTLTASGCTLGVAMNAAARSVKFFVVQSHGGIAVLDAGGGNFFAQPVDVSEIATEVNSWITKKADGSYQAEISFSCTRPGDVLYVTAIATDAQGQEGVHVLYMGVTPDTPTTPPNPPTLTPATGITSSSGSTVATIPGGGTGVAKIRTYLDGAIYETQVAVGGGSTQTLTVTGLRPGTWHKIGASCLASDGTESTIAFIDAFLTTSGGTTPDAGQLRNPTDMLTSWNALDQLVSISFTPGSGNPDSARYHVLRATTLGGTYIDTGNVADASPAVTPEIQLATSHVYYYKLKAVDPTGAYASSDASTETGVSCSIPGGRS